MSKSLSISLGFALFLWGLAGNVQALERDWILSRETVCDFRVEVESEILNLMISEETCEENSALWLAYRRDLNELRIQAETYCEEYYKSYSFAENDPVLLGPIWKQKPESLEREIIRPWVFQLDRFEILRRKMGDIFLQYGPSMADSQIATQLYFLRIQQVEKDAFEDHLDQWKLRIQVDLSRILPALKIAGFSSLFNAPTRENFLESSQIYENWDRGKLAREIYLFLQKKNPKDLGVRSKALAFHQRYSWSRGLQKKCKAFPENLHLLMCSRQSQNADLGK